MDDGEACLVAAVAGIGVAEVGEGEAVEGGFFGAVGVGDGHDAGGLVDDDEVVVVVDDGLGVEVGLGLGAWGAEAELDAVAGADGLVAFDDAGSVEEDLAGVDPGTGLDPGQVEVDFDGLVEADVVELGRDEAFGLVAGGLGVRLRFDVG